NVADLRRLLQIPVNTLGLENSISRSRTLGYLAQVGAMLLERGEQEQRLQELEAALRPRLLDPAQPEALLMPKESRLDHIYAGLTALERAKLVLKTFQDERREDPGWRLTMPQRQTAEFNQYIYTMNAANLYV